MWYTGYGIYLLIIIHNFTPNAKLYNVVPFNRGDGEDKEYYVKWKELQYDECSWELESDICSFQQEIERFNKIQSRRENISLIKQKSSLQDTTESKKKQKEFQQYECSPEFLSGGRHNLLGGFWMLFSMCILF